MSVGFAAVTWILSAGAGAVADLSWMNCWRFSVSTWLLPVCPLSSIALEQLQHLDIDDSFGGGNCQILFLCGWKHFMIQNSCRQRGGLFYCTLWIYIFCSRLLHQVSSTVLSSAEPNGALILAFEVLLAPGRNIEKEVIGFPSGSPRSIHTHEGSALSKESGSESSSHLSLPSAFVSFTAAKAKKYIIFLKFLK